MKKSDSEIKFVKITEENIKEGQKVRIIPSVNILKYIVDIIADEGLSGMITKGKDDKLYLTASVVLVAEANEIIKHEIVIEDGDIEDFADEEQSSNYRLSEKFISRLKKKMEE